MSAVRPQDVLFFAGGECLEKFGVPVMGFTASQRVAPAFARTADVGAAAGAHGQLLKYTANRQRVEYVKVNGVLRAHFLFEPERDNELLRSQELDNAAWTKGACTILANDAIGPDGVAALDVIVEDNANAEHAVAQNLTGLTANASYALSGFFKSASRTWVRLRVFETANTGNTVSVWFNLATGAVGTTSAGGTGAVVRAYVEDWTHVLAGLYRCVLVCSVGNGATASTVYVQAATADQGAGYQGADVSAISAGYLQLEDAAQFASSYVATTSAVLKRNAEGWSIPLPHDLVEGTILLEFRERGVGFTTTPMEILTYRGDSGAYVGVYGQVSSGKNYWVRHQTPAAVNHDAGEAPTGLAISSDVRLRFVVNGNGSTQVSSSVGGGAETAPTTSTTPGGGLSTLGPNRRLHLCRTTGHLIGAGAVISYRSVLGVRGNHSMAEMLAVFA